MCVGVCVCRRVYVHVLVRMLVCVFVCRCAWVFVLACAVDSSFSGLLGSMPQLTFSLRFMLHYYDYLEIGEIP